MHFHFGWVTVIGDLVHPSTLCDYILGEITVIADFIHLLAYLTPLSENCIPAFVHTVEGQMAKKFEQTY